MARILIIEDDAQLRAMLRQMLESAGHEVSDAQDGRTGVAQWASSPADLIITDILMPDKDGLEAIMEVRRTTPHAKIIAITGGGNVGRVNLLHIANQLGAQRTLLKPFDRRELLSTVRELLDQP
ncbi:MAG: response regulator [Planctomycetota bacterium]